MVVQSIINNQQGRGVQIRWSTLLQSQAECIHFKPNNFPDPFQIFYSTRPFGIVSVLKVKPLLFTNCTFWLTILSWLVLILCFRFPPRLKIIHSLVFSPWITKVIVGQMTTFLDTFDWMWVLTVDLPLLPWRWWEAEASEGQCHQAGLEWV